MGAHESDEGCLCTARLQTRGMAEDKPSVSEVGNCQGGSTRELPGVMGRISLEQGASYTGIQFCQNSLNNTLQMCAFYCL